MKIPVGEKVTIDLWDPRKGRGMAKRFGSTLDLVQAASEYPLHKGDEALVVASRENFVQVIPANRFSRVLVGSHLNKVDEGALLRIVHALLVESERETGGIKSVPDLFQELARTPLKRALTEKKLRKACQSRHAPFEYWEAGDQVDFVALEAVEVPHDQKVVFDYAREHAFLTRDMLQAMTGWPDLRVDRILAYLHETARVRKDASYRTGTRYYFVDAHPGSGRSGVEGRARDPGLVRRKPGGKN